ncbi:MAG: tRNA lysidine(34) synthetase TilS [Planctomycetes bacterium]|nr:tRNA lysidine(34) synthetase TilS [Planctomycetota bacterium]
MTTSQAAIEGALRDPRWTGARIGVACSGGPDSMALLAAVARTLGPRADLVCAIHVQHGLRGDDSLDDRRAVWRLAQQLRLTCTVPSAPVAPGPGLEARARDARYRAIADVARLRRLTCVMTAHHEDDQIETVLMRIARGAGPRGLRGIPATRPLIEGCDLVRPLLSVPRSVLRTAAEAEGLPFRHDPSNDDLRFERNRVRQVVLPGLLSEDPNTRTRVLAVRELADATFSALERTAAELVDDLVLCATASLVEFGPVDDGVPDVVLFHVAEMALAGLRSGSGRLEARAWRALVPVLRGTRATTTLGGDLGVRREADVTRVTPRDARLAPRTVPQDGVVVLSELDASLTRSPLADGAAALSRAMGDPSRAVIARSAIKGRLRVRSRESGDRMLPLGGPGRSKVADLLSEAAVPRALRPLWPIVVDDLGALWVPGVAVAERGRWTDGPAWELVFTNSHAH